MWVLLHCLIIVVRQFSSLNAIIYQQHNFQLFIATAFVLIYLIDSTPVFFAFVALALNRFIAFNFSPVSIACRFQDYRCVVLHEIDLKV